MAPKAGTKSKSGETITEPQNGKSKSEKQVGEPAASQNGTTHPPYIVMAKAAISELNEKGGSSRQAILKFVTSKYSLGSTANRNLNNALKKLLDDKEIVRSKLTTKGANGSFKLAGGKINSKPKEETKKGDHKKEGTGVEPTSEPKSKKAKTSGSKVRMEKLVESSSASSAESESDAPVVKKAPKLSQIGDVKSGGGKRKVKKPRVSMTPASKKFKTTKSNASATGGRKTKSPVSHKPKVKRAMAKGVM